MGQVRGTFVTLLLMLITFGIYQIVYVYMLHDEMKRHTGRVVGGGIAVILAIFVGIVLPYMSSAEVGDMRQHGGREQRVSWKTGLWYFPGIFILIGPLIGFAKMNGALNDYWESLGARR